MKVVKVAEKPSPARLTRSEWMRDRENGIKHTIENKLVAVRSLHRPLRVMMARHGHRLKFKAGLRRDPGRRKTIISRVLLMPERALRLNGPSLEIVSRCDGTRTVAQIVHETPEALRNRGLRASSRRSRLSRPPSATNVR